MIYCDRCGAAMDDAPHGMVFMYVTWTGRHDSYDFERTLCDKCYALLEKFLDGEGGEGQ